MSRHMQKRKSLPERRNFQEKSLPDIIRHHDMYFNEENDSHSAPNSRSNSFRSKTKPEVKVLHVDVGNQRRNSEPSTPLPTDSLRQSRGSITNLTASKSDNALYKTQDQTPTKTKNGLLAAPSKSPETPYSNCYKVAIIGADGVGKTALTKQFLSSESMFFNDSPGGE
ncbi:unnamed protein product [Mytilus coruscus]|uniref:Uncharacterized protein n=1 Tax=Mytilus coruscus TaxID=42192 RepID=A0A6J8BV40_MYTCO|nr:unnamed protein product [Mytilus coruscus]